MSRFVLIVACGIFVLVGCNQGPTKHKIFGAVKLDDEVVSEAELTFLPDDRDIAPEGAQLRDGKYEQNVPAANYRVKIFAPKKVPLDPGEPSGTPGDKEKIVNRIPVYYDENPPTIEITGPGEVNFQLSSKK